MQKVVYLVSKVNTKYGHTIIRDYFRNLYRKTEAISTL